MKMSNSNQEPPASSKAPNDDLKDMDVLCTFKIKIESQNSDHGCIKDQWPYPNQDKDSKPQSVFCIVLQSPNWGLKGHGCSLHLKIRMERQKFVSCVYKRPFYISASWSRCKTPIRIFYLPPKSKSRLKGHGCSLQCQTKNRESRCGALVYQVSVTISKSR